MNCDDVALFMQHHEKASLTLGFRCFSGWPSPLAPAVAGHTVRHHIAPRRRSRGMQAENYQCMSPSASFTVPHRAACDVSGRPQGGDLPSRKTADPRCSRPPRAWGPPALLTPHTCIALSAWRGLPRRLRVEQRELDGKSERHARKPRPPSTAMSASCLLGGRGMITSHAARPGASIALRLPGARPSRSAV
jgi:hypothetical protein